MHLRASSALWQVAPRRTNLLAAREEQRRQLDENGVAFADLRRKLTDLDLLLQAQQRLLGQNGSALNDARRRLYAVEAGMQQAGRRSTLLKAKATAGQVDAAARARNY